MGSTSLEEVTKGQLQNHKNTHFMLVDGMSKLMNNQVKMCQSSDFIAAGVKWNFLIKSDATSGYLFCYLLMTDPRCVAHNWVKCTVKLSVVSLTGIDNISEPFGLYFDARQQPTWRNNYLAYPLLKEKYLVNDKAVFAVEVTSVQPSFTNIGIVPTIGTAERLILTEVPRNNSKFTWKITQFSSFTGFFSSSYEFTIGQRRWRLDMYPKGDATGVGHMSLYLTAADYATDGPKGTTLAIFKLRVLDQIKRIHHEANIEALYPNDMDISKTSYGQSKFLPLEELHKESRGFLVNDQIFIGVEFLFVSTSEYL